MATTWRERETVAVLPCSGAKLDRAAPARELYVGQMFRQTLAGIEAHGFDRGLVLSARHGLVDLDTIVEPYDVRMGDDGSITIDELAAQVVELFGEDGDPDVYAFLPSAYLAVADAAFRASWIFIADVFEATGGIGEQRGVNRIVRETSDEAERLAEQFAAEIEAIDAASVAAA